MNSVSTNLEELNIEIAPAPITRTDLLRISHMGDLNASHMESFVQQLIAYQESL